MKLISWNCQGAFRKKAEHILTLNPDILVVQECEHPDKMIFNSFAKKPNQSYWYNDGGRKGIALFSYSDYTFEILPGFNSDYRYVIPFQVTGKGYSFILLAIWAIDNKSDRNGRYIAQVWSAINHYKDKLGNSTILIGDFNSNKIWDHEKRLASHSDVVKELTDIDIHSVYHKHFESEQGSEIHPTFYLHRYAHRPYHIDYCFVSNDLLSKVTEVEVGSYDNWITHSDHSPLSVKFDM